MDADVGQATVRFEDPERLAAHGAEVVDVGVQEGTPHRVE